LDSPPAELSCQSPTSFEFSAGKEFLERQNGDIENACFLGTFAQIESVEHHQL
jgi:hypothetical protein